MTSENVSKYSAALVATLLSKINFRATALPDYSRANGMASKEIVPAAGAPGTAGALVPASGAAGGEQQASDALALETELQFLEKDETRYRRELRDLADTSRAWGEQLEWMQDRVGDVSAELGRVKTADEGAVSSSADHTQELSTLREVTPVVTAAFRTAVKRRFGDAEVMSQLSQRKSRTTAVFARVYWQQEYADWKVLDTEDGTEVTFEALLDDVSRYWGVPAEELILHHSDGGVWPLDSFAASELRGVAEGSSTSKLKVWLSRRPQAQKEAFGGKVEVEWQADESKMSSAERRRLDRQRREMLASATKTKSKRAQMLEERRALVNDLLKYVVFITLYLGVLYSRRSVKDSYELVQSLRTAFVEENFGDYNEKAYGDIAAFEEFYGWAQGPFTEGLLPAELYNEEPVTEQRVMYYNRVVGGVRLRQNRVGPDSCPIGASVKEAFMPDIGPDAGIERRRQYVAWCYGKYNILPQGDFNVPSTEPYGPANGTTADTGDALVDAFRWRDEAENNLVGYKKAGLFGIYDGSGFVVDITNLTTDALVETLDFLYTNDWLDRGTRGLHMTMMVYNANYNLYALCQFFLELSPAGVMVPKYTMQTVKMDLFTNEEDLVGNIFEIVLYTYFLYYICIEGNELYTSCKETGSVKEYFSDAWNVMDWGLIIMSFVALSYRLLFFFSPIVRDFDVFSKEYIELSAAARFYELSFAIDSMAAFLALMKLFKYFGLQRNLLILRNTISRAVTDLSTFSIILVVFIFAFAVAGNQIFGQENEEYVDEARACVTLFRMILGDFDFAGIERVQGVVALVYFWCYQILVFFIMVNIFLAILNDAYIATCEQFAEIEEEEIESVTIAEHIRRFQAAFRQRQMDRRIEQLRAVQRKRELNERRAQRKVEEARARTLKSMGMMYNKNNQGPPGQNPTANAAAGSGAGAAPAAGAGGSGGGVEMNYAQLKEESGQQV